MSAIRNLSHRVEWRSAKFLPRRYAHHDITPKQRLVILGSGWGGYNVARQVDKTKYDVTVISPNSYFSFTPFLASTCVGTLEFRQATEPVRNIKGVAFNEGRARSIDWNQKSITVESALSTEDEPKVFSEIEYDKLVVAVGCFSASFGVQGVKKHAHFLKDIKDARRIRTTMLERFEQASNPALTSEQRKALLSFRIVGGGPTGVEFSSELHDFVHQDVHRLYPGLEKDVSITLYDVGPGILQSFDASLRDYAMRKFDRDGVDIQTNTKILAVGPDWIELENDKRLPCGLLVWSTGLCANPLMRTLDGVMKDERGQALKVDQHLRVLNEIGKPLEGVFALGDNSTPVNGPRVPATAQVASQMATHLSKNLNLVAEGTSIESTPGFTWRNKGSMAYIGGYRALVDRSREDVYGPKSRLAGMSAWFIWRSYYASQALGWRNRLLVPMHWGMAWLFGRDVVRF